MYIYTYKERKREREKERENKREKPNLHFLTRDREKPALTRYDRVISISLAVVSLCYVEVSLYGCFHWCESIRPLSVSLLDSCAIASLTLFNCKISAFCAFIVTSACPSMCPSVSVSLCASVSVCLCLCASLW